MLRAPQWMLRVPQWMLRAPLWMLRAQQWMLRAPQWMLIKGSTVDVKGSTVDVTGLTQTSLLRGKSAHCYCAWRDIRVLFRPNSAVIVKVRIAEGKYTV
eukprot:1352130-Pyramimonas_sp.AAC.1